MSRRATSLALAAAVSASLALNSNSLAVEPIQFGFLWHMHQPIYYPGENIIQTDANHRFSFSVTDVHNQRFGPYTTWPRDAIVAGQGLPNLGASVSFSGSLMQNLNTLQSAGVNGGMWNNWTNGYKQARAMNTVEGNPRLDLIGFGHHHALMPLMDVRDMRMQIQMHKTMQQQTFGSNVAYSKGFFPAETAFSERMIPALKAEGFDWTIVDNIHFDRATKNYPHTNASGLYAPNRADQINDDPAASGGAWMQLNNLWAPSKVSAPFSYRPHNVQHVDPNTGAVSRIVAVPGARYEGNEDGRGGFGALQYESVMNQYRHLNTDPNRPMFVVLHHDGDNYGGGSDAYYHSNFQSMVNWANGTQNYRPTTIADYLKKYPVPANDVIHVENGSWAGADNGDAEFKKWLADPNGSGWSPDRNSWAVLTAAKNRVYTAEDLSPISSTINVINGTGNATDRAWHFLSQAQSSDHWYWDGTQPWDSNVTRGANLAVQQADQVIGTGGPIVENTPPSVFVPQRDAYNPGAHEFGANPEPSDFRVWTYAYDVSGLTSVTLKWRTDNDGENPLASVQNETYSGGGEVGAWNSASMTSSSMNVPPGTLAATYRALEYGAMIQGQNNKLLDYYVEAVDARGNVTKSDIQHVWVGGSQVPTSGAFTMDGQLDSIATEIASNNGMKLRFAIRGGKLYVATNDAGEGSDHFIYLAKTPGAMRAANWAKAGQIAGWDAFLADENDNGFSSWFDASGTSLAATGANGGVLEGVIDLTGEMGEIPAEIYLAVGLYATADGGALLSTHQVPASLDGNGNIEASEYFRLTLPVGWAQPTAGNWSNAFNWFDLTPNSVGAHARFLNAVNAPTTVTADFAVTVGQISFDSDHSYTIAGPGTITLDVSSGSGSINVARGNHLISAPVVVNDPLVVNVQRSQDVLTISSLQPTNSSITKSGIGAMHVNNIRAATLAVNAGTVQVIANGTGLGASRVASVSISPTASLDLGDSDLVVTSMSMSAIIDLLRFGRNDGSWDGVGGISSKAAREAFPTVTTLGVLSGAEFRSMYGANATFDDFPVADSDVLVKYTYYGDTDFNGIINFDDYGRADNGFNNGGDTWFEGDFDLNGVVNFDDFARIDAAFLSQSDALRMALRWLDGDRRADMSAHPSLRMVLRHSEQFGPRYNSALINAVPEPEAVLLGSMLTSLSMFARRRKSV